MKTCFAILLAMCSTLAVHAQSDSLGLPGDNFNLCGVLELFKTSSSPDDFEKALNKKDKKINNLDLNEDGEVDYLNVIDNSKDGAHAIVIRTAISKTESQDIAVIEVEKKGENNAQLQIVGDPFLYGEDYIIEPKSDKAASDNNWGGFKGFAPAFVFVNVWYWPCVSYMWYPDYVIWISPWYYGYYPSWWYPWAPMPYYSYYQHVYGYNNNYYWTNEYRMSTAHNLYQPRRVTSGTVGQRTAPARQQAQSSSPRRANGQSPVPSRRPTAKETTTSPRGGQDTSTPRRDDATPAPPAPRTKEAPAPSPRRDAPAPRPRTRPDVHSSPSPKQAPAPRTPQGHRPR